MKSSSTLQGWLSLLMCSYLAISRRADALRMDAEILNMELTDDVRSSQAAISQTAGCENGFKSFILSVNSEFVEMTGAHLMAMMVNAMTTHTQMLRFDMLPNQEKLDAPENWSTVAHFMTFSMEIDILIFACQECHFDWLGNDPLQTLSAPERLGLLFDSQVSTDFFTATKFPIPSKMFISAIVPRTSKCRPTDIAVDQVSSGNKGAVMLCVTTPISTIAYAGTHLDAKSPEKRNANIEMIMSKLREQEEARGNGNFDHVYIFGDLNYRLKALPSSDRQQRKCRMCLEGKDDACDRFNRAERGAFARAAAKAKKRNNRTAEPPECKWCYPDDLIHYGGCQAKGTPCPKEVPNKLYSSDGPDSCAINLPDYNSYMEKMFKDYNPDEANGMYNKVKDLDSLHNNMEIWSQHGFSMAPYTDNTPPTYKWHYKPIPDSKDVREERLFAFYKLLQRGGAWDVTKTNETRVATKQELKDIAGNGVYKQVPSLKECEFTEGCMDFGWLDRLMYKGNTDIEILRSIKMHWTVAAGDHAPIFMLLNSKRRAIVQGEVRLADV